MTRKIKCVAAGAARDVERRSTFDVRDLLLEKSRWRMAAFGAVRRMTLLPTVAIVVHANTYSTRASTRTSTRRAPARLRTRAHSSTVAPVV